MAQFKFSGHGNFSGSFGWDNGINSVSVEPINDIIDPEIWKVISEYGFGPSHNVGAYFENAYGRGFYYLNEHGGSRSIWGEVCAWDEVCAEKCVQRMSDQNFPITEYKNEEDEYLYFQCKNDPIAVYLRRYYENVNGCNRAGRSVRR